MQKTFKIGTRESQLAVWQATAVKNLLEQHGHASELVFIKSEGDIDLQTPLYEMGVQGIFTRSLDMALLNNHIDIAVHSMKDVPTQLPAGIVQAAVLQRASYKDLLVYKDGIDFLDDATAAAIIATSSIRRKAQWLHRYPHHQMENLRGNVNTRLRKLQESNWNGAIFAAAGLERIGLRPAHSIELDWMLPAPAQGAIMVVCRQEDEIALNACLHFNDAETALCTKIERDFLRALLGGCATPISALATIANGRIDFRGNVLSTDGKQMVETTLSAETANGTALGIQGAEIVLQKGAAAITAAIRNAGQ